MKILVIEDEAAIRNNAMSLLRMGRFDMTKASIRRLALALAHEYLSGLILFDAMVPELDGYGRLGIRMCAVSIP